MPDLCSEIAKSLPADFWSKTVIVAVSGGCDSLGLLVAIHQLARDNAQAAFQLHAGHFDHQWSPRSQEALQSVKTQCKEIGVRFHCDSAKEVIQRKGLTVTGSPPRLPKLGLEATARTLRYAFLEQLASRLEATYVLTGHTADDQVETVLMRIGRGTSVSGLVGIQPLRTLTKDCQLLRPLLSVHREQLEQYLERLSIRFYVDPSNSDIGLTRNRVRQKVLPWLEQNFDSSLPESLLNLQRSAVDNSELSEFVVQQFRHALMQLEPGKFQLSVGELTEVPESVVRQLLVTWWHEAQLPAMEMNRNHWCRLATLVLPPPATAENSNPQWLNRLDFPGFVRAVRSQKMLTVQIMTKEG